MELTRKQKATKYFFYCLMIIAADLLQNTPGLFPQIFGARCLLLIPIAIILTIGEDAFVGTLFGLFTGLLWDLTGAVHLGFNCIFIAVICFLSCAFVNFIARDTLITNIFSSAIAIALYCLLYWLLFIIIKGVDGGEMTLFSFYIPCAVYTIAVTPLLWLIIRPLKMKLNHETKHDF